jgi:hypothetical protein
MPSTSMDLRTPSDMGMQTSTLQTAAILCIVALGFVGVACIPPRVQARYTPSATPAPSAIQALQVGVFLEEEQFEHSPSLIAESGKFGRFWLPVPAGAFLRDAFRAEVDARRIVVADAAKRVSGELLRFEYPCAEQPDHPTVVDCSMRFRFTVREHAHALLEKIYEQHVAVAGFEDRPERELVAEAFVQLLKKVYSAFLEDPAAAAALNAKALASAGPQPSSQGPQDPVDEEAVEGRGWRRVLKNNRIYVEVFGRGLIGVYYDRKVLEYGYVGLGSSMLPPAENIETGETKGGIWGNLFVGCNTPNLFRNRLFGELSLQTTLIGNANPNGTRLIYTLGYAYQTPGGFDLQLACTWHWVSDYPAIPGFCGPRFDFGKAF